MCPASVTSSGRTLASPATASPAMKAALDACGQLRACRAAGSDPWGGHSLEWLTSSPPPAQNFTAALPAIRSAQPALDVREALTAEGAVA